MPLNVLNRCGYASTSRSRSATTSGVIQPAQSLVRGNSSRSSTSTEAPDCTRRAAQEEPAGPPPTTMTSTVSTTQPPGFFAAVGYTCVRVHGTSLLSDGAHTTWKSWRELAKNAAEHPARYSRHARMNSSSYTAPDRVRGAVESRQPFAQRSRVVQSEVLDVDDGKVERFEDRHHFAQARGVASGEDSLLEPRVDRHGTVAPDAVHERESIGFERSGDDRTESFVVLHANVLEHADGHERVAGALDVAVVVQHELYLTVHALA